MDKYYKKVSEQAVAHCTTQDQVDWCVNNGWTEISQGEFNALITESGYTEWEWDDDELTYNVGYDG